MPQFTPPTIADVPPTFPDGSPEARANPLGHRLHKHKSAGFSGRNVYIVDGVATEEDPVTTYDADGDIDEFAIDRIQRVFWGSTSQPYTVTDDERTLLEAAGFEVEDD